MKIFFGAAIQGLKRRGDRSEKYKSIIATIKNVGHTVLSEHATGCSFEDTVKKLEESLGPLPPKGIERIIYVRNRMIQMIEGNIGAAIFEVSTPSLGTGIEIAHAYLRPRMKLPKIPVLVLYEKNYWPNNLSTMIRGITKEEVSTFHLIEYENGGNLERSLQQFLTDEC